MSELKNLVSLLSDKALLQITQESNQFDNTGIVADTSELRRVTEIVFSSSSAMEMLIVSREVYRVLALRQVEQMECIPHDVDLDQTTVDFWNSNETEPRSPTN